PAYRGLPRGGRTGAGIAAGLAPSLVGARVRGAADADLGPLGRGQAHDEARAPAIVAWLELDAAPVRLRDGLDDRESQPEGAAAVAGAANEALEQRRSELGGHSRPVVLDHERRLPVRACGPDADASAGRRVPQRVL